MRSPTPWESPVRSFGTAGAAGKSVADLAAETNIPLQKVVDAAVAAYSEQLDGAVTADTLNQGQADALKQLAQTRTETDFRTSNDAGRFYPGPHMVGGLSMMMREFGFGPGRRAMR